MPAASTATVRLNRDGNATTFHAHGGGRVISRLVNEFGIAKKVAMAIAEAFGGRPYCLLRAGRPARPVRAVGRVGGCGLLPYWVSLTEVRV